MSGKNIVVYTCIIGNYDKPKIPKFTSKHVQYVLFTDDRGLKSDHYEVRYIDVEDDNKSKTARHVKLSPHIHFPEYEYSVWVDGSITVVGDFRELIEKYLNSEKKRNLLMMNHRHRTCLYSEANTCIKMKADIASVITNQIQKYKKDDFPVKWGLMETGIQIRRHNEEDCKKLFDMWWDEVKNFSRRDQLSFTYCAWKTGIKFAKMENINSGEVKKYFNVNWHHGK